MKSYSKYLMSVLLIILSFSVFAEKSSILTTEKNTDGSEWLIEKNGESYNLKYINAKGDIYSNDKIITSDIEGSGLFLNSESDGTVSLVMDYPRDVYTFKFTSGKKPLFISACKQITLPSSENQVEALLTLCSKDDEKTGLNLSSLDVSKLLKSDNLVLKGKVKTLIGSDKAFLYDENKKQQRNKPYLIKGDVVEILEYKSSMLHIKYTSKSRTVIAWIKFIDIL
ncbi:MULTISPECIES: hypothetical protein [Enterobacter cloacae complex]|nr:hypothetical protein [Enterobacter hormaechei]ARZ81299.1 hypothetical protein AM409_24995 [Enterobacter cloacae complex sp.]KAA0878023.1 hypothetical protein EYC94_22235 [Enterobacter hormaechei]KLQ46433.1 hypothetical protein ABF68_22420 [Enterobacter hormaechei subsp. steigerwaltii]KUR18617.1 hypothetical protein AWI36_20395 [Enterobacter hormaechei subsp. steigerwaltii]KVJ57804.1 hypothetical protein AWS31_04770 [Enterobacter hormaechei subsp. steigerwaltii]